TRGHRRAWNRTSAGMKRDRSAHLNASDARSILAAAHPHRGTRRMKHLSIAALVLFAAILAACSTGPVRRVSEPAASIQQLTVAAQGNWSVELRVQNYGSIAMRFDTVALELEVGATAAGTLHATPALQVSRESPEVLDIRRAPSAQARLLLADALAAGR